MAPGGKRREHSLPLRTPRRPRPNGSIRRVAAAASRLLHVHMGTSHADVASRPVAKGQIYVPGPRTLTHAGHAALFPDLPATPSRAPSRRLPAQVQPLIRCHGSGLEGAAAVPDAEDPAASPSEKRTEISTRGASMGTNPSQKIPSTPCDWLWRRRPRAVIRSPWCSSRV